MVTAGDRRQYWPSKAKNAAIAVLVDVLVQNEAEKLSESKLIQKAERVGNAKMVECDV